MLETANDTSKRAYRKLFVVGCPRSGTSWTSEMTSQHPDVVKLPGESHLYKLFYDPFTYLQKLHWQRRIERSAWIFKHYGLKPILTGFNSDNIWASFPRNYRFYERSGQSSGPHTCIDYKEFVDLVKAASASEGNDLTKTKRLIASIFEAAFYNQGGDDNKIMLEKTPMHIKYADVILRSFSEAKVIEVVRDVRGVCASWQARAKTQRWSRKSAAVLVNQWNRCIKLGEKFKQDPDLGDRILRVRYEDLRQDPLANLQAIFEFAGLPISDQEILNIIDTLSIERVKQKGEGQHIRRGIVGGWKTELSADDFETCNQLAGPLLEKLGYSHSQYSP